MKRTNKTILLCQNSKGVCPLGRIITAAYNKSSGGILKWRRLPCYALVYLYAGTGLYRDSYIEQNISPGDTIILFPGEKHQYGPVANENWDELYILFEGKIFDLWFEDNLLNIRKPVFCLRPLRKYLNELEGLCSPGLTPLLQICGLQKLLADMIFNSSVYSTQEHDREWLKEAEFLLSRISNKPRALEDVATRLGVSYETFRHRFKQLSGISPGKFRTARIMEEASRMILENRFSFKEIADNLGFCDEFHFSRRFKGIMGLSPGAWRAQVYWRNDEKERS